MSEPSDSHPTGALTSLEDPPSLSSQPVRFRDRREAGRRLATLLERFAGERPVVVAIPRGGVPVAAEVARALGAPLEVTVVRKLGAPQNPEFALGALAENGVVVLARELVEAMGLSERELLALVASGERECDERVARYRGGREQAALGGRTAILVDDGLATGRTATAAVESLRKRGASRVILAVPVAAPESARELRRHADEVVCVEEPEDLWAVGYWYEDFRPTPDEEVLELLARYGMPPPTDRASREAHAVAGEAPPVVVDEVLIPLAGGVSLSGDLAVPEGARGVVAFAHGSGSSRLSPRNMYVAETLNREGFGTLLFDLLTAEEEADRRNVFDIGLLSERLLAASAWLGERHEVGKLPLGYFGASTGAAAALTAAAKPNSRVAAVVSRGGRPDLTESLGEVRAPTLLIVGGADPQVLELNRLALRQMRCERELAVVPGATHLFEEPGALEQVGRLAIDWLLCHLAPRGAASAPAGGA